MSIYVSKSWFEGACVDFGLWCVEMITEQKKEFRRKMKQKRLELKQMMVHRKVDPIYKPPNADLPRKQYKSSERTNEGVSKAYAPPDQVSY